MSDWMPSVRDLDVGPKGGLPAGYHVEEYHDDNANVVGRIGLQPESTAALTRLIKRTAPEPAPRQPRGPLMEQRMAKARRDLLRRIGNIA